MSTKKQKPAPEEKTPPTSRINSTIRGKEERKNLYDKIQELRKNGTSTPEACEKFGVNVGTFYTWQKRFDGKETKNLPTTTKKPKQIDFVQLEVDNDDEQPILIVAGRKGSLNEVLRGLSSVFRG